MGIQNPAAIKESIEEQENEQHREYMKDIIEHPEEQSGGYIKAFEGDCVIPSDMFNELVVTTKGKK